ncbi:hypothetical protein KKJ06_20140 [Xenorhabdus bovienii]|nr:BRO family protein [Xenorhabdus bovienii]MDE9557664.1 hypothetical protein [Xenorhabdus bovienii]
MKSIIKHFEFKSSNDQLVTIYGLKYKGKPVFFAVELAQALGYTDPHQALKNHCKSLIKLNSVESTELGFEFKPKGIILTGQSDMFRLVMRSNLPSAERFQDWVFESVLPSIMETGSYSIKQSQSGLTPPDSKRRRVLVEISSFDGV